MYDTRDLLDEIGSKSQTAYAKIVADIKGIDDLDEKYKIVHAHHIQFFPEDIEEYIYISRETTAYYAMNALGKRRIKESRLHPKTRLRNL